MIGPEERKRMVKRKKRLIIKRKRRFRKLLFLVFTLLFIGLIFKFAVFDKFFKSHKYYKSKEFRDIYISSVQNPSNIESYRLGNKFLLVNPYENPEDFDPENMGDISHLPDEIQKKIIAYPETYSTMIRYKEYEESSVDISSDLRVTQNNKLRKNFPYFSQWDERWAFLPISDTYFARVACGPTVMTSVYIGLTGDSDMNPIKMADFAQENLWFDHEGTNMEFFIKGAEKLGLKGTFIEKNSDLIRENLDKNKVLVCLVGAGDFTQYSHYIMLLNYVGDRLIIYDPNSYENSNITWDMDRIINQSSVIIAIEKE